MLVERSLTNDDGVMRPSMSGETPPGHRMTIFVHHFFTLPLGPVRLAFTELHKSFVSHFAFCSTQKNASNARRIHKTIVRLVRRSSFSSTLFHRRKNAYVSHLREIFSVRLAVRQTYVVLYVVRSPSNDDLGGGSRQTLTAA